MKLSTSGTRSRGLSLLLFFTFALAFAIPNYSQYQISPLGPQIMEQFGLNMTQFNSIFTAPMIPAIFTSLICGLLVDRFGYKPVLAVSIALTAGGAWLRTGADSYATTFTAMILIGFSGAFLTTAASKVLSQLFGQSKVSQIMGFALSCSTLSLCLSMATTARLGMKRAFLLSAVLATLALVLWLAFMPGGKTGADPVPETAAGPAPGLGKTLAVVLKNPYIWLAGIAAFCVTGAMAATGSMVPTALMEVRGFDADTAGLVGAMMMVGNLLGSLITPTITLKTGKFRPVLMLCGAVSVVGCTLAWRAPAGILLYLAMIVTGYTFGSGMSQLVALAVRLPNVGPVYAGTAGGLVTTLQLLGGVALPTYIAAPIAGGNYALYFLVVGLSSLVWIGAFFLLPKSLDVKG